MSYNTLIDLSKFLASNVDDPDILINFYNETPILDDDIEAFLERPLNDKYKKYQEKKLLKEENEKNISLVIKKVENEYQKSE
jgi:hypothetical protein